MPSAPPRPHVALTELGLHTVVDGTTPCNGNYSPPGGRSDKPGGGAGHFFLTFPPGTGEERAAVVGGLVEALRAAADDIESRFTDTAVWR